MRHYKKILTQYVACCAAVISVLFFAVPAQAFSVHGSALDVNDPGFTPDFQNVDRQWSLSKAKFIDAWNKTTGSNAVVVAIIDTGIDETHEDLRQATFVPGYNFITNAPIDVGTNSDDNGHGTLVAGILGAVSNNGIGIVGTNWRVSMMPVKALESSGSGASENVAKALMWATDHGANIINLSLGGVGFGQDLGLANAITYAFRHNVVIVAAAGNDTAPSGGNIDQEPVFPICDDNGQNMVIGVAATDAIDQKPAFSNYGKTCVDVSAPGKRILSTISLDPITRAKSPNSYAYASGTSLAAPLVSGQAALLKAAYPDATNAQIRDRIISTADPIDGLNTTQCSGPCAGKLGRGRINVAASLSTPILPEVITEGDLVQIVETDEIVVISGGKKLHVSSFVQQQRYGNALPKRVYVSQVAAFPEGQYAQPVDGTLVKKAGSPVVYYMQNGIKMPVTYEVFLQRKFGFDRVFTLSDAELDSWLTGRFLPPSDGALVRSRTNHTVYWVVGGVLHPITATFYSNRGLKVFPIAYFSDGDIKQFPKGEAYLR